MAGSALADATDHLDYVNAPRIGFFPDNNDRNTMNYYKSFKR